MSPSSGQNIKLAAGKGYHKRYKRQGLYHCPRAPYLLILWCYVEIKTTFIVWLSKNENENIVMEISRPQALNTWILETFLLLQFFSASLLSVSWIVDHWTQDVYVRSSQERTIQLNFINTETAANNIVSRVFAETQSLNLEQVTVAVYVPLEQALKRYTPPFRLHSVLTGLLVPVPDPHAWPVGMVLVRWWSASPLVMFRIKDKSPVLILSEKLGSSWVSESFSYFNKLQVDHLLPQNKTETRSCTWHHGVYQWLPCNPDYSYCFLLFYLITCYFLFFIKSVLLVGL